MCSHVIQSNRLNELVAARSTCSLLWNHRSREQQSSMGSKLWITLVLFSLSFKGKIWIVLRSEKWNSQKSLSFLVMELDNALCIYYLRLISPSDYLISICAPFHFCTLASLYTASFSLEGERASVNTFWLCPRKGHRNPNPLIFSVVKVSSDIFGMFSGTCKHTNEMHKRSSRCVFLAADALEISTTVSHKLTNRAPTFGASVFPFNKMALWDNCITTTDGRVSVDSLEDFWKRITVH